MPARSARPSATSPRLDPRQPFVLHVRELGRRPGSLRPARRTVPAPAGLGVELARVPEGSPVELDLRLESVVEGVLVSGRLTAEVTGECARCLEPVADRVEADVQELFAYAESATDETTAEDEVRRLAGDLIDLEPLVRDALVLALPLAPLCRDDCRGLCATCGAALNDLPSDHDHPTADLRWAALAERFGGSTESQE